MDVIVHIVEHRSLSQSELILRNLRCVVQIGNTSRSGSGVCISGATFRSGTAENPLIITIKNSQTDTNMYVRNIPISAVLGQNGSFEQWVAVYPPGDPQNLHFDASAAPKDGCPQVRVRVCIEEDLLATQCAPSSVAAGVIAAASAEPPHGSAAGFGFAPQPRPSVEHAAKVDQLRRSVDSLQAELAKARDRVNVLGNEFSDSQAAFASSDVESSGAREKDFGRGSIERGRCSIESGDKSSHDKVLREKELQAQRIKEHVAEMANAHKRAQDVSRNLQSSLRTLDELTRQFKGLELQIAEQRASKQILERERDQIRADEMQLQEQIQQRNAVFRELQSNRDEIDKRLSSALSEHKHHSSAIEASTNDFHGQKQSVSGDIDQSKKHVSQLAVSLKSRESMIAEIERRIAAAEEGRRLQEVAKRDNMRAVLDQTRREMTFVQADFGNHQRCHQSAKRGHQEMQSRLSGMQSEANWLQDVLQKGADDARVEEVQVDVDVKKEKLEARIARAELLEDQLSENRQQLSTMSSRVAELHNEVHEKELAKRRCEDAHADLQRKMEAQRRSLSSTSGQKESHQSNLSRVQQELEQARCDLQSLETTVNSESIQKAKKATNLNLEVQNKQQQLAAAQHEVDALQTACQDLENKVTSHKESLQEQSATLESTQTHVVSLTRKLSDTSTDIAGCDEALTRLREDESRQSSTIEEVAQRMIERKEDITALCTQVNQCAENGNSQIAELEKTVSVVRADIDRLKGKKVDSQMQRMQLEGAKEESLKAHSELEDQIKVARSDVQSAEAEVHSLLHEKEAADAELEQGKAKLASLLAVSSTKKADLESTQGQITLQVQEVSKLEAMCQKDVELMEANAASLGDQYEESCERHKNLCNELEELECEFVDESDKLTARQQERAALDCDLHNFLTEQTCQLQETQDHLRNTEAAARDARIRASLGVERIGETERRLSEINGTKRRSVCTLASIREEVDDEAGNLHEVQEKLGEYQMNMKQQREELRLQESEALGLEVTNTRLEQEIMDLTSMQNMNQLLTSESEELQRKHKEVLDEDQAEDEQHAAALDKWEVDINQAQLQLQRGRADVLQRKNDAISQLMEQVQKLEAERSSLAQQVHQLDLEKHSLENGFQDREKACQELLHHSVCKEKECDALQATMRGTRTISAQLQQRQLELGETLTSAARKEMAWRSEAEANSKELQELQSRLRAAVAEVDKEIVVEIDRLNCQKERCVRQKSLCNEFNATLEQLKQEDCGLQLDAKECSTHVDALRDTLAQKRAELADIIAERQHHQSQSLERSVKMKQHALEKEQRSHQAGSAAAMRKLVRELEDSLQQASDRLVEAQDAARRKRVEEEELRIEVQRLRESMRSTTDKMTHQLEHGNLQYETLQKLQEQKENGDREVEVLTLGLHDAEQRNEYLQKENCLMQQQVEGLYEGSLQEWAAEVRRVKVAAEVALYKEEIDMWKQKAECLRKERQVELNRLHRQHEGTVARLRDRVASLQAEIAQCEQSLKRREVAIAKLRQQGSVEAPAASVMPGLVVPQRPLSSGHHRRKALLVGINYSSSHAPLKGCINDIWNLQCLLRYTLQYSEDQIQLLLDGADGRQPKPDRAPNRANILAGMQWLVSGAQPGDNLLLVFSGYGAQHPRCNGSDQHEAYFVPSDFAADLPVDFFHTTPGAGSPMARADATGQAPGRRGFFGNMLGGARQDGSSQARGYRLVSLMELNECISRLPPTCRMTLVLDCCYSVVPGISPKNNALPFFGRVERGRVDYAKLRDYISRPRFLDLPVVPVQHTPGHLRAPVFPQCWLHCFSACKLQEWCAEFPIEGTVQGAFSWAFLKAMARGHFHCGVYQFQQMLTRILADLKLHFKGVEQTPLLQLSQSASMQDVVLWT